MSFLTTTGTRVNDGYTLLYRARLPDCAICLGIPVACSPQAWAAGTPLLLLQSSLGLEFDPDRNEILLRNPRLPQFLEEVALRNLRLGQSGRGLDAAPARQRRVAPGIAQRRADHGGGGVFVTVAAAAVLTDA